jgi:hypothetical protein
MRLRTIKPATIHLAIVRPPQESTKRGKPAADAPPAELFFDLVSPGDPEGDEEREDDEECAQEERGDGGGLGEAWFLAAQCADGDLGEVEECGSEKEHREPREKMLRGS